MNTLLIALPCLDSIKTQTVMSLIQAMGALPQNLPTKLHMLQNTYVHDARNKMASTAIRMGMSHVLFLDSDIQFKPEDIQALFDDDKDIVGGLYYRRQPPHSPTFTTEQNDKLIIPDKFPKDKPFKVFAVATGFMLVKTSVFLKIPEPWFFFGSYKGSPMGEDVYFGWKAKRHGFDSWVDPRIELGHVGEYVFDHKDYEAYVDLNHPENKSAAFNGDL